MLPHFQGECGSCELELEQEAVVIDLIFADYLEFGFDGLHVLSWDFFRFSGEWELYIRWRDGSVEFIGKWGEALHLN